MHLPRLQLFEFGDLPWFPRAIRDLGTDYLQFMEARFALHKPVIPLLLAALHESHAARIVDLCSGGGGPLLAVYECLAASGSPIPFLLTDKFPNLAAFRRLSLLHPEGISYLADSCDAANVPKDLAGLRTIFNGFHHFGPAAARSVLACAVEARQPIGIFEIPDRRLAIIVSLFFTPLFIWIATPFIRPFRWQRLVWTYVLPVVPAACWWDGLVSQFRAYTVAELLALTKDLDGYSWKAGRVGVDGTIGHLTYLIGLPITRPLSPG